MIKVFFSYSHKDEELRNELDKHLTILKRQAIIDTWHDRRILGGAEFETEIDDNLKDSNIILLLVSSDFLASNYCYDKEMMHAMKMHEEGSAVVLPVILRPCDWHDSPFGKLLAVPMDGRPVVKFPSYDEAFLEIVTEIKRIIKNLSIKPIELISSKQYAEPEILTVRSSNLRIKKEFTDHQRDKFLDEAFEYMFKFFEGSLNELQRRNPDIDYRLKRIDAQTFSASLYFGGQVKAECMVFYGSNSFAGRSKSISFSYSISTSKNSSNESLYVRDDGYVLYLSPLGMYWAGNKNEKLTFEGASEYYWEMFIKYLQN